MTRDIGTIAHVDRGKTSLTAAIAKVMAATGAVALRHYTDANGYLVSEAIDAKDWQVDPVAERDGSRGYISAALYSEALAQGRIVTKRHEPIPIDLVDTAQFHTTKIDGLFNAASFEPMRPRHSVRPDLAAPTFKSKRVKANRARKRAARKARRAQS